MTQAAFPSPGVVLPNGRQQGAYEGMSLRDYFAANVSDLLANDELSEILTEDAKAELAGRPRPKPSRDLQLGKIGAADEVTYPLDLLKWYCEVRAGIRYTMANAMMVQRDRM